MDSSQKYEELGNKTLPGLFLERVRITPNEVACRSEKFGIYKERTWSELKQWVTNCAMGLKHLGLRQADRLALMGHPCEEYVIYELVGQALGTPTYGIYPTPSPKELNYLMKHGRALRRSAGMCPVPA